jgi:hypothetical protein
MSKTTLKKHLLSLTKEQIIEQVLDLYDSRKPAKEYFEYFLDPNEKKAFEKYKAIIVNEFYPTGKTRGTKCRFSVAKKAIADFRSLNPAPELLGDLMVTLVENACQFAHDSSDLWEQFYTSTSNNFELALKYLQKNQILNYFRQRNEKCVKQTEYCGYGFSDEMDDLFNEYYK